MPDSHTKKSLPLVHVEARSARPGTPSAHLPRVRKLNLMLTEQCNLDCFMCDFGKRNKRTKRLPLSVEEIMALLDHPIFAESLESLTLTGGEPFMFPGIERLYLAIRDRSRPLRVNFSSNTTLIKPMLAVFDHVRDWTEVTLFVSIDGIEKHDAQRGTDGSFKVTVGNLETIRNRYPLLPINVKFTITPVNYDEILATFSYFQSRGFNITGKMVENNRFYTNNLSHGNHSDDFAFTPEQLDSVRSQLASIIEEWPNAKDRRLGEVREALDSLSPAWRRPDRCLTPTAGAFIDSDLNFFSCKEYGPVANLRLTDLADVSQSPGYGDVIANEERNTGECARCTSLLKMRKRKEPSWQQYLASYLR